MTRERSGEQKVETEGLLPGEGAPVLAPVEESRMPEIDKSWVEKAQPGLEWVWPPPSCSCRGLEPPR